MNNNIGKLERIKHYLLIIYWYIENQNMQI